MVKGESGSKAIVVFAVLVFVVSLFSVGVFYLSAKTLFNTISGYSTVTATANLSVEPVVIINFTTALINWGSGRVNSGASSAGLNTYEVNNVTNGNWTLQNAGGLRIENLGNVNVSLNISGTKTAAVLLGGTTPIYRWNISNAKPGSCLNATGGTDALALNLHYDVNTTTALFCPRFRFADTSDVVRIDFNLSVPSDSHTGALSDTITAVAILSS